MNFIALLKASLQDPEIRAEIISIVNESKASNDNGQDDDILAPDGAGELLKMSTPAVRIAAWRKRIPSFHIGRALRFSRRALLQLAKN